jgi:hypothetical protein
VNGLRRRACTIAKSRRNRMRTKFTITVEGAVYQGSLDEGYRAMAADEEREREAREWSEGLVGDVADEPR